MQGAGMVRTHVPAAEIGGNSALLQLSMEQKLLFYLQFPFFLCHSREWSP